MDPQDDLPDTTRRYPRGLAEAFPADYRTSALGITEPPIVLPHPLRRLLARIATFWRL